MPILKSELTPLEATGKLSYGCLVILAFLANAFMASAQPATLQLIPFKKVNTEVTRISEVQVFTINGVYSFKEIERITFWQAAPGDTAIYTLRTNGVTVYLTNTRLAPLVARKSAREYTSKFSAGVGYGFDYGGIGFRFTALPAGPVSFFGGTGYNLAELGYNVGMELKIAPYKRSTAFASAMYGCNAVIVGDGAGIPSETFYGPSFGLGAKWGAGKSTKNYWSGQFIFPIRSQDFKTKIAGEWTFPVHFSIGFHFGS